jgi:hypothetical protein
MKAKTVAIIAGLGIGAYLLYKFWGTAKTAINNAANAAADPIADAITWMTLPAPVKANYNFILPTGVRLSGDNIALQTSSTSDSPRFTYNGIQYIVTSRDVLSNDYLTVYANLNQIPAS